jgi:sterol desaturase/sphingolipid hydroxylase (fatty acid hydroxylase superfamily)
LSLIGPSAWAFAIYQLVFQAEVLFHHSNVRLPIGAQCFLNKVLVTPRMHGIHHSQVHRENNSNFGTLFPWWDRLHRTLGVNMPQAVRWWLPIFSDRLARKLSLPFHRSPIASCSLAGMSF